MADKKLIIVMANSDPRNGEEIGAPIFQATVAAAMDFEVEVICTATAGRLMKKGVAEKLFVKEGYRGKGIGTRALEFLKDIARLMGVTALRLEVERKNASAHGLYRKAGFEDQDRHLMTNRITEEKHFA